MKVIKKQDVQRFQAPNTVFTGEVWVDHVIDAPEPGRTGLAFVTFSPGARTHWHHHPYGQILNVVSGRGFIRWKDGPASVIEQGDSVWIGPGEVHAHGAAPDSPMCHAAVTERSPEGGAYFLGEVSDEDYHATFVAQ